VKSAGLDLHQQEDDTKVVLTILKHTSSGLYLRPEAVTSLSNMLAHSAEH